MIGVCMSTTRLNLYSVVVFCSSDRFHCIVTCVSQPCIGFGVLLLFLRADAIFAVRPPSPLESLSFFCSGNFSVPASTRTYGSRTDYVTARILFLYGDGTRLSFPHSHWRIFISTHLLTNLRIYCLLNQFGIDDMIYSSTFTSTSYILYF